MAIREVIFRGKRADNGEWVEGDLLQIKYYNKPIIECKIMPQTPVSSAVPVLPETVGQFTGLTDRNGKRIFEGDIVNVIYTSSLGEEFTQITTVRYDETECCFYPMRWEEYCVNCDYSTEIIEIIVISNIHDSPELLGEEENESDSR